MHRVWLIAGVVLILLGNSRSASASVDPFEDYAQNIHPHMVHHCAECHSRDSNRSRRPVAHSDRDPSHAYPIFLGLAVAPRFENSSLYTRVKNEHYCLMGENCGQQSEIESEVLEGVRAWLGRHAVSLATVADGAQTAAVAVPGEADASFTVSVLGPRQAWGAPEVRATVRAVLGSTYRLDRLELRGAGGTWRVRDVRVSVNGAPVFASALNSIDFRATLGPGPSTAPLESYSAILFERPLGSMAPGQALTLSAKIEPVEPREGCPNLEVFETIGVPWILSGERTGSAFSVWTGLGLEQLAESLAPGRRTRADVLHLCNRYAERLSPAVARSPMMADILPGDRLMASSLAHTLMNPPSWLIDVLRAPKAKFEALAFSTTSVERSIPGFTCGRTAEGDLHCWGGRFGSRFPPGNAPRALDLRPNLDPQEAGRRRIRFPDPIDSFAISDSGLVCAIGRSTRTVRCAGHVEPPSLESSYRVPFNPSPAGANYEDPREAPYWNSIPGDRAAEIAAFRDNFCVRMESGRVFCHGPQPALRGLGPVPTSSGPIPGISSIFSSLGQRSVPVPIQEPVESLFGISGGFCAVKGPRAYCWGHNRTGGLITEGDFALLENRSLEINDSSAGSRGVSGWTDPQRPSEPPRFLSGRLFAEPIKKIMSATSPTYRALFFVLTESGRLFRGSQVQRATRGPPEDQVAEMDLPDAADFSVVASMSGLPCILTKAGGQIVCPNPGSTSARYFSQAVSDSYRVLNLREPQAQLGFIARTQTLCGLGASDGQVRCLDFRAEPPAIESESAFSLIRLRHLMGFGFLVPDVSLLTPIFIDGPAR